MLGLDTSTTSPQLSDVDVIQQWSLDNKKITVGNYQGNIYYFISQKGQDTLLMPENIAGIPQSLGIKVLTAFLQNTWVRVSQLSDGTNKLIIQPKMCGGANINVDPARFWPGGIIPYEIDTQTYPVGEKGRQIILAAIVEWNNADTGFQFVPRTNQTDVLVFGENDQGTCYSNIGRQGGVQYIRCHLENSGFNQGSIMHEIGHAIGFYHEHQRYDRDQYLDLTDKNLSNNDDYRKSNEENMFDPYDFWSIMHYSVNVPLTDGQQMDVRPGIFPNGTDLSIIGNRQVLSEEDKAAARALYEATIQQDQARKIQGLGPMPSVASTSPYMEELTREPEYQILKQKGDAYFTQQNYSEAFKYYHALINEYGDFLGLNFVAHLYDRCGACFYNFTRYKDAQQWFEAALKLTPHDQQIQANYQLATKHIKAPEIKALADQLFEQKNYQAALVQYNQLVKNYADIMAHLLPSLNNLCGVCCYHLGKFTHAEQWFAVANQLAPKEQRYIDNYNAAARQKIQSQQANEEACVIL